MKNKIEVENVIFITNLSDIVYCANIKGDTFNPEGEFIIYEDICFYEKKSPESMIQPYQINKNKKTMIFVENPQT